MKKLNYVILSIVFILLCFTGCSDTDKDNPGEVTVNFLNALQSQDYAHASNYYTEKLDAILIFRNKLEAISPAVANELFSRISDFNYNIKSVSLDTNNSDKAYVTVSIQCQDLGPLYEKILIDYLKTDLEMTFDGAKDDELIKQAEETILSNLEQTSLSPYRTVKISLTKTDDIWKIDKISNNAELLDILTGNMISTLNSAKDKLTP